MIARVYESAHIVIVNCSLTAICCMWLPCGCHMITMWYSCDYHVVTIGLPFYSHVVTMQLLCAYHVVTCDFHVVIMWYSCSYHVVFMWLPCGYHGITICVWHSMDLNNIANYTPVLYHYTYILPIHTPVLFNHPTACMYYLTTSVYHTANYTLVLFTLLWCSVVGYSNHGWPLQVARSRPTIL